MTREGETDGGTDSEGGAHAVRPTRGRLWGGLAERVGRRRTDALALSAVALVFVCFFPQALFDGKFLIAGDAYYYSLPLRSVAWGMIRAGKLPLWTPHVLSGFPLLAMPQLALGYPLTWGYAGLPAHWAEQLYVLAPYLLAPLFTYAYARGVGRTRPAALLAGLAFTYGGAMCGGISNSGLLTNGMMWLPLALLGVERARRGRFAACLLTASLAYAMSVLNGHAQTFVYVGLLIVAYGFFLSLGTVGAGEDDGVAIRPSSWRRWRPLAVACGAVALAAGLAAFQLFETARAARRSTRVAPTFETLAEGSFRPLEAARALFAPLHALADMTPYVAPLALALAAFAIFAFARGGRGERDARVIFWVAVALVAWLLMLGGNTPLQRAVFHTPALNRFRVPSRHAFEWTFALSVLAAYGFDQLSAHFARLRERARPRAASGATKDEARSDLTSGAHGISASRDARVAATRDPRADRLLILSVALLAATSVIGALWWRAAQTPPAPASMLDTGLTEPAYLYWKLTFTSLLFASAYFGWRVGDARLRAGLLAACVLLGCFVEPNAFVWRKWGRLTLDAQRFAAVSEVTRALQREPPERGRVYTRVDLFVEEFARAPRLEGPNLTALHGLHNVAGVEPLIQERYSRALGGVGPDSVTPRAGFAPNLSLFGERSRVLDILNTTHVVSYANLQTSPAPPDASRDGVNFAGTDLGVALRPGERAELDCAEFEADAFAVVSSLSNAGAEEQGAEVARVRVFPEIGRPSELVLRAGVETAEWAHERADVRPVIRHALAPVYESRPGDGANSFPAYSYLARVPVGRRAVVERVEIENVSRQAWLMVSKASLADTAGSSSRPLYPRLKKWARASDGGGVSVLQNLFALPRAWLVAEAESVDGEEALRRISGESEREFDPRRTALLEVAPAELPALPGGELAPGAGARVVEYNPNALTVETESPTATLLVVSEMFYPGWEARVDGQGARIHLTDFLLRGVAVPAGRHRVEMRYRAPAARKGAALSSLTLLLLCVLTFLALRKTARRVRVTPPTLPL